MDLKEAKELFRLWPNYSTEDVSTARDHFIQEYCPDEAKYPEASSKFMAETESAVKVLNEECQKRNPSVASAINQDGDKAYVVFSRRTVWSSEITEEEYEQFKAEAERAETADEHMEVVRGHFVLDGYKDVAAIRMKHRLIAEELQKRDERKRSKESNRSYLLAGLSLMVTSIALLLMSALPAGIGLEFGMLVFGALAFCGFYNMVEKGSHLAVDCAGGISVVFSFYYVFFHLHGLTPSTVIPANAPATWVNFVLIVALLISVGSNLSAENRDSKKAIKRSKIVFLVLAIAAVMYVALVMPNLNSSITNASQISRTLSTEQSLSADQDSVKAEKGNEAGQKASNELAMPDGVISWNNASDYVGETIGVHGPVVDTHYASGSNGQPTYLNIGAAYPSTDGVSAVIWGEDAFAFPSGFADYYNGKNIVVWGELYVYNNTLYIKVVNPSQIDVLD